MRVLGRAVGLGAATLSLLLGVGSCSDELPPLPEVVLVVDTDALVPRLVDRLRVDFYGSAPNFADRLFPHVGFRCGRAGLEAAP